MLVTVQPWLARDLEAAHDVSLGVGQGLALLQRDEARHLRDVLLDQLLVAEHDLLPRHRARLAPRPAHREFKVVGGESGGPIV